MQISIGTRRGSAATNTSPPPSFSKDVFRTKISVFSFSVFFQAEDGIRDLTVTGVQTCALPIYGSGSDLPFADVQLQLPPVEAGAEHPRTGDLSPTRSARRLVGIDLGTTNSAVAWMDASDSASRTQPRLFEVLQVTRAGETGAQSTLPSFLYFPTSDEQNTGAI